MDIDLKAWKFVQSNLKLLSESHTPSNVSSDVGKLEIGENSGDVEDNDGYLNDIWEYRNMEAALPLPGCRHVAVGTKNKE